MFRIKVLKFGRGDYTMSGCVPFLIMKESELLSNKLLYDGMHRCNVIQDNFFEVLKASQLATKKIFNEKNVVFSIIKKTTEHPHLVKKIIERAANNIADHQFVDSIRGSQFNSTF